MLMGKNDSHIISTLIRKSKRKRIENKNLRAVIAIGHIYQARNDKGYLQIQRK